MVLKVFKNYHHDIHSMANATLTSNSAHDDNASVTPKLIVELVVKNQTNYDKIQTVADTYQISSTTRVTSEANRNTQATPTRIVVSSSTINSTQFLDKTHHTIMVAVLLGIFTCISLTLTISVIVFCRKKNSVFMLQKCEQESDVDLEMNDLNTEIETSDSEYECIQSTSDHLNRRSQTCPNLATYENKRNEENGTLFADQYSTSQCFLNRQYNDISDTVLSIPLLKFKSDTSLQVEDNRDSLSLRWCSLQFDAHGAAANTSEEEIIQNTNL